MDYTDDFGKAVTIEEANAYVEGYMTLNDTLIEEILPLVPTDAAEAVRKCVTFHMSKSNAFVFDAALIKPFFEGPDVAKYMIAYLGAAGDPSYHPPGRPAIEGLDPNKIALMMAVPPREHPPRFRLC